MNPFSRQFSREIHFLHFSCKKHLKNYNVEIFFSPRFCCSDFPTQIVVWKFRLVFVERLMVHCRGLGWWKWFESLFFIRAQLFFLIILFSSRCHSLNMQHQTNSFMEKNVHFMHIHRQNRTDVDTNSHTTLPFPYLRKRNPHFRENIFFFVQFTRASLMMIFILHFFFVAVQTFRYQYVCIVFNSDCGKKASPSCVFY